LNALKIKWLRRFCFVDLKKFFGNPDPRYRDIINLAIVALLFRKRIFKDLTLLFNRILVDFICIDSNPGAATS
jgi:hypothetical protein